MPGLIRPAKDVRDAEREVLDAVRELANGRAGQNAVIDAYERLTVARAEAE